ncbi:MAG: hypothetical protein FWD71_16600 [Oscillospiraceae bacterium]|nr:hypothetical protein [Oscillospiraceae bacterium]
MNIKKYEKLETVVFTFLIIIIISGLCNIYNLNTVSASSSPNYSYSLLTIERIDAGDGVWAGNTFKVDVIIKNNANYYIDNVRVSTAVFGVLNTLSTVSDPQRIEAGTSNTFSFLYQVDSSAQAGNQAQIQFTVSIGDNKVDQLTKTITVTIYQDPYAAQTPHFQILAQTSPTNVSLGSDFKIAVRFVNLGALSQGVMASIKFLNDTTPIAVKMVGDMLVGDNAEVMFDLNIKDKTKLGANQLVLSIYNAANVISDFPIDIYIDNSNSAINANLPNIQITSVDLPVTVKRGDTFQLKATLQNTGADAENIEVTITCQPGIDNTSSDIIQIASLKKDEQQEISLDAVVTPSAADNYNQIKIEIKYAPATDSENPIVKTQYAGFNVLSEDTHGRNFAITAGIPDKVNPGEDFTLSITIQNNGADEKNFYVAVTVPDGVVNKSVNTFPISELKAGDSVIKEITFSATDNAVGKYCLFNISVYGMNPDGTNAVYASQYVGTGVGNAEIPQIIIDSVSVPQTVNMGDTFDVGVTVSNTGTVDAQNIILSMTLPSKGILNQTSATVKIDSLKVGEKQTADFTFIVTQDASYGYNSFTVEASYGSASGTGGDRVSQYFGVIVNSSDLKINSVKIPSSIGVNSDFNVNVSVTNTGADADGVILTLTPASGLINKSSGTVKIDSIKSGETIVENFTFMALDSAQEGYAAIDITLTHGEDAIKQYSGTNIVNPAKNQETTVNTPDVPVIIINKFSYGGGSTNADTSVSAVYGGKSFYFSLEFLNTNKEIAVKDLKITISQEKGVFNPQSGSNTFFVDRLEPGQTVEKSIELVVQSDAAPGSYGITVAMSYKSDNGDIATDSEIINIPVQQEIRFSVGEIPPINDVQLGDDADVNIQFGNLGKSLIYNVVVRIEGDGFINSAGNYYAGNIDAGKFLSNDFYLTATVPGMQTGKFIFEYEDADGNQLSEEKDFSFNVIDTASDMGMGAGYTPDNGIAIGPDGQPVMNSDVNPDTSSGFWLFTNMNLLKWLIVIGIPAVIVIAVIVIIVQVRRKKKKEEEENEDEENV